MRAMHAACSHGIPGIPRAKCNLYDIGCEVALAVRWPGRVAPGALARPLAATEHSAHYSCSCTPVHIYTLHCMHICTLCHVAVPQ